MTPSGLPWADRGGFWVDGGAAMLFDRDGDRAATLLATTLKLRTFLDERAAFELALPFGFGNSSGGIGNPMIGIRGFASAGEGLSIRFGGDLGLPVLSEDASRRGPAPFLSTVRGDWDQHEFYPDVLPFVLRAGLSYHVGNIELRFDIDPAFYVPIGDNDDPELVIQHGAEIQVGHRVGGGARLQGVARPTFGEAEANRFDNELYQASGELFFAIQTDEAFARVGLVVPFDQPLGPLFDNMMPFRIAAGMKF